MQGWGHGGGGGMPECSHVGTWVPELKCMTDILAISLSRRYYN